MAWHLAFSWHLRDGLCATVLIPLLAIAPPILSGESPDPSKQDRGWVESAMNSFLVVDGGFQGAERELRVIDRVPSWSTVTPCRPVSAFLLDSKNTLKGNGFVDATFPPMIDEGLVEACVLLRREQTCSEYVAPEDSRVALIKTNGCQIVDVVWFCAEISLHGTMCQYDMISYASRLLALGENVQRLSDPDRASLLDEFELARPASSSRELEIPN
jgi:hypothetical protein